MLVRVALVCLCVLGVTSAGARELTRLTPEQARAFVVGKLFSFHCFDGTVGMGRIFADGSVVGTIRPPGSDVVRFAALPPGTIKVTPTSVCAHLAGLWFHPCFNLERIDYRSFRGSLWGLSFAYCDFHERSPRAASRRGERHHARTTALAITPPRP